jgi:hypothetical protein
MAQKRRWLALQDEIERARDEKTEENNNNEN